MTGFYVADDEIQDRVALLDEVAISLMESGVLPDREIVFFRQRIPLVVNGYFLLNWAYKKWRISEGHFTKEPKIAALLCMAIATFQPVRALEPEKTTTIAQARANEIYALTCASSIIKATIDPATPEKRDFWLRLLDILARARSETLEPYVVDINHQIDRPLSEYDLTIVNSEDKLMIDTLVCIFELLAGLEPE